MSNQPTALPHWDMSVVYPGLDSPEFAADFAAAQADVAAAAADWAGSDLTEQVDGGNGDVVVRRWQILPADLRDHGDDDGRGRADSKKLANSRADVGVVDLAGCHQADTSLGAAHRNDASEGGRLRGGQHRMGSLFEPLNFLDCIRACCRNY